jgi:cobalt/nickel transport system permease protein
MTLAFDAPPGTPSRLRGRDPRWLLAGFGLATAAAAAVQSPAAAAVAAVAAAGLALAAGLSRPWLLRRLGTLALALVPLLVLLPLTIDSAGPAWWEWGWLRVSVRGTELAATLALRALAILALALTLLASAAVTDLARAARSLLVPGLLVQLFLLSYRYTFVLAAELFRLRVAIWSRGFRARMNRHTYRTVGHVTGTLLVRGTERAERVAAAMRCRGFDGHFRTLTHFRTRPADVLTFLLLTASAAALVAWDLAHRGVIHVG